MSAATFAQQGLAAIDRKDYAAAIPPLDRAIADGSSNPNPSWLLARAQAHQQEHDYERALLDTDRAYHSALARQQAKTRETLALAQYRRAVILASQKRYADADACCVWSQQLVLGKNFRKEADDVALHVDAEGNYLATVAEAAASTMQDMTPGMATPKVDKVEKEVGGDDDKEGGGGKDKEGLQNVFRALEQQPAGRSEWMRAYMWRSIVLKEMEKLPPNDPGRKITVPRVPEVPNKGGVAADAAAAAAAEKKAAEKKAADKADEKKATEDAKATPASVVAEVAAAAAPPPTTTATPTTPPPAKKLRVDMYQTTSTVSLTLYAKGVDAQALRVESPSERRLCLSHLPAAVAGPSQAVILMLGGAIDTAVSTEGAAKTKVTPYKIELQLTKKTPGEKWASWGQQEEDKESSSDGSSRKEATTAAASLAAAPEAAPTPAQAPAPAPSAPPKVAPSGPVYPTSSRHGPKDWEKVADEADAEGGTDGKDGDGGDGGEGANVDSFFKTLYASSSPDQQRAMMKSYVESNGTSLSTDWDAVSKGPVETKPPEGVEAKKW